ncbi:MAG TPA: hypothetical protein VGH00_01685, partial [Chthoniobacterales bacterium]
MGDHTNQRNQTCVADGFESRKRFLGGAHLRLEDPSARFASLWMTAYLGATAAAASTASPMAELSTC